MAGGFERIGKLRISWPASTSSIAAPSWPKKISTTPTCISKATATCGSSCGRTRSAACRKTTLSWLPKSTSCRSRRNRELRAECRALVLDISHSTAVPAYVVRKDSADRVTCRVEPITAEMLPPGDVLIRVEYSSLNYKDALATQGHPGVVRTFPHVPGIDCAGTVVESAAEAF